MNHAFIIVNEWTDMVGNTSSEVVGATFFEDEGDAWNALAAIAEGYDTRLYVDETSFAVENHTPHLSVEEYYITELTKG